MMRSLFSGVSGLRSHQTMMDVTGDNIANINTAGFKGSRVIFSDTLSQVMRGGSAAGDQRGGVNAMQIGLGTRVAGVDMVNTQGSVQATGRPTDVAIQGEGYFAVRAGGETLYTRGGSFGFDDAGNLADPTGAIVQGWLADPATGQIVVNGAATDIRIPLGQTVAPEVTTTVTLGGNLNSKAAVGSDAGRVSATAKVYDSLGAETVVTITYTKTGDNAWTAEAFGPDGASLGAPSPLTFNPDGSLAGGTLDFTLPGANGAQPTAVTAAFGEPGTAGALTQFGSTSGVLAATDGAPTGYMRSYAIGDDGTVSGSFSNGEVRVLGQLAVAGFTNPAGLIRSGSSHMRSSPASGDAQVGLPGELGRGTLSSGYLEGSNVDLAQEFTQLMIAQRGFQANSRIISTSDEMLQELVNLKR